MADEPVRDAARLEVDYPDQLDRLTSFLRAIWIIPIEDRWSVKLWVRPPSTGTRRRHQATPAGR